ncbi:MAG TPA: hypothetical protein VGG99_21690 [Acetobacteraceae bacterium]|jgi:hypothetical protein
MAEFRYYCLDERGKIIVGGDLVASDLNSAIQSAQDNCKTHPIGPFHGIEIWQGTDRLHSGGCTPEE